MIRKELIARLEDNPKVQKMKETCRRYKEKNQATEEESTVMIKIQLLELLVCPPEFLGKTHQAEPSKWGWEAEREAQQPSRLQLQATTTS